MGEDEQVQILKNSGLLTEFVRSTGGNWTQQDWEKLLEKVKERNIMLPPEVIGSLLEAERVACAQGVAGKESEGEVAVNFDKLTLRKRRRYLEEEIRRRLR